MRPPRMLPSSKFRAIAGVGPHAERPIQVSRRPFLLARFSVDQQSGYSGTSHMSNASPIFDPDSALVEKMSRVRLVIMDVDGTITSSSDRTAMNVSQTLGRLDSA